MQEAPDLAAEIIIQARQNPKGDFENTYIHYYHKWMDTPYMFDKEHNAKLSVGLRR